MGSDPENALWRSAMGSSLPILLQPANLPGAHLLSSINGHPLVPAADWSQFGAHERVTRDRLLAHGYNVTPLQTSNIAGIRMPDVLLSRADLDLSDWDFKAPTGAGKRTIANQFKEARKQSSRMVLDLHRSPFEFAYVVEEASRRLYLDDVITHVLVISKDGTEHAHLHK
jgi:hypothetical protein